MIDATRLDLLLNLRRYREAEAYARECLAQEPDWAEGHTQLARALLAQERIPEAVQAARTGVAKNPESPFAHAIQGYLFYRSRHSHSAMACVREALRLLPSYSWAWYIGSKIHEYEGRPREMLGWANDGLKHEPQSELLLHQRGWALKLLNRRRDASQSAEQALVLHPNSPMLWHLKACIHLEAAEDNYFTGWRQARRAEAAFREAIRFDPTEAAYRENALRNQLTVRKRIILPTLVVIGCVWFLILGTSIDSPSAEPQPVRKSLWLITFFAGLIWFILMSLNGLRDNAYLLVPLKRFGFSSPPLDAAQRRQGLWRWRAGAIIAGLTAIVAILHRVL